MQPAGVSGVGEGSSSLPVKGIHTVIVIIESEPASGHMDGKAGRHRWGDVPMAARIPGSRKVMPLQGVRFRSEGGETWFFFGSSGLSWEESHAPTAIRESAVK